MESVSDGGPGKPLSSQGPPSVLVPHEMLHPQWWIGSVVALGIFFLLFLRARKELI